MPTPRQHANGAQRQAAYRARLAAARSQEQAAQGLPPLPAIATLPGYRRWENLIRQATLLLETAHAEMEGYYDQRTECWQASERGEAFLERLLALQEAHSAVEGVALEPALVKQRTGRKA